MRRLLGWSLVACVACLVLPAAAVASVNLLPNPGFESGSLTGWTPVTATGGVSTSAFDGSYAAQLTWKSGTTYGLRTTGYPVASTTAGHAYAATVEVETAGATETLCQRIREYTPANVQVAGASKCLAAGGAWTALPRLTYFAAATGNRLRYDVFEKAAVVGDTFSMDDAALSDDPVVFAAGDIACETDDPSYNNGLGTGTACRQAATANLINPNAAAVLPLGDEQYECGTLAQFQASYGPTWGAFNEIARPAVGNHEYGIAGVNDGCTQGTAQDYFTYFSSNAGDPSQGYYSYGLGDWHLIALNSNCTVVSCAVGSPQETWLRADLASHPAMCTLAYFHHPLFSSTGGLTPAVQPFWNDLYAAGADLVLDGHAHVYERFSPQTPAGASDPLTGITQITVGTGGVEHGAFGTTTRNSVKRNATTFGVLRLVLHQAGWEWRFLPDAGSGTFADAGSGSCH
jgi:acid phosphatase type 7